MKIGVDLDETIINFIDPILEYIRFRTGLVFNRESINQMSFSETFGRYIGNIDEILNDFFHSSYFDDLKPFEGSVEVLTKLSQENGIYVVTSRYGIAMEKTPSWIEKYLGNIVTGVFYTGEYANNGNKTKEKVCQVNKLELMLEDDPLPAMACAESGIKVLLFRKDWNKNLRHDNIFPVNNWKEAQQLTLSK